MSIIHIRAAKTACVRLCIFKETTLHCYTNYTMQCKIVASYITGEKFRSDLSNDDA